MRSKIIIFISLSILIILGLLFYFKSSYLKMIKEDPKPIAIWYIPHPDDETIFMGGSIKKYSLNGYRNILVLFTKGGKSSAIYKIKPKLTHYEFEMARVNEFMAAIYHLGVNKKDIIIYDFPDGNLKKYQDQVYNIILKMEYSYPSAIHNSMSYHDKHEDHKTIGESLLKAYNEKHISNATFYLNNSLFDLPGTYIKFNDKMKIAKIDALNEYKYVNPNEYRFGIGYMSVPSTINNQIKNPREKIHKPNQ